MCVCVCTFVCVCMCVQVQVYACFEQSNQQKVFHVDCSIVSSKLQTCFNVVYLVVDMTKVKKKRLGGCGSEGGGGGGGDER